MLFEFTGWPKNKDGTEDKDPVHVPTHVSIRGEEYRVREDRCIDAPARATVDLAAHGFVIRTRDRVVVQPQNGHPPPEVHAPPAASATPAGQAAPAAGAQRRG